MVGVILILVVLLIAIPVSLMMTGAALSAIIGGFMKSTVDAEHDGTEDLAISEANPYNGPEPVDA